MKNILVKASLIVSFLAFSFGVYRILYNDFLVGFTFVFGSFVLAWEDWTNILKKKKLKSLLFRFVPLFS